MKIIPAADLGLMADHLSAHEGVINRLGLLRTKVSDDRLEALIALQINMMLAHVYVMLDLINPYHKQYVEVPSLNQVSNHPYSHQQNHMRYDSELQDRWIALDVRSTAKNMADQNYASALMMHNQNVRNAHVEMALQQLQLMEQYGGFIEGKGWSFTPQSSVKEQLETLQHFQHMFSG